ncbi:MAG: ATP synthase subunit C [Oscillospiraceae bacterium]|jgi:V/A-type H+-transporting ATPase subunit K|nr:ATP synthase subunit C [Oscillospiraceae bacterium]
MFPMQIVSILVLVAMIAASLYLIYRRKAAGKPVKHALVTHIVSFFAMSVFFAASGIAGQALAAAAPGAAEAAVRALDPQAGLGMIAAALAVGISGVGSGIAVAASGAAALGAISENDKTFGKALIFVALAEGIALYGLIIAFSILNKF